jgi:hypothetical protein
MKMEQTECSETPEYKIQTSRNHLVERVQHSNTAKVWNQELYEAGMGKPKARVPSVARGKNLNPTLSELKHSNCDLI